MLIRALIAAMQAKDADGIRTAFATGAGEAYGSGTPKTGDAFRAWLQSDIIAAEGRVADPQFAVDGDSVVVTGQYNNKGGYSAAANVLFTVADGKITSWTKRY